jgi:hypothetical protein
VMQDPLKNHVELHHFNDHHVYAIIQRNPKNSNPPIRWSQLTLKAAA